MVQVGYNYSPDWDSYPVTQQVEVRKIRRTYKKSDNRKKFFVTTGFLLFVYALILVYLCIKGATLGYQIVELENQINQIETDNHRIEYNISRQSSLSRIEQVAVTELGMHKPLEQIAVAAVNTKKVQPLDVEQEVVAEQSQEKPLRKLYASLVQLADINNN